MSILERGVLLFIKRKREKSGFLWQCVVGVGWLSTLRYDNIDVE
jgi:hypothetical protein